MFSKYFLKNAKLTCFKVFNFLHARSYVRPRCSHEKNNVRYGFFDPKNISFDIYHAFYSLFVRARVRARAHGAHRKKMMSDLAILTRKTYNSIYIMHFKVFLCARAFLRARTVLAHKK